MGIYLFYSKIPAEYQEVEYIESSWTQYIDTWYNPQTSTEFDVTYEWTYSSQQYANVFWTRKEYNTYCYYIWYSPTWGNSYYWFGDTFNMFTSVAIWWSWVRNISYHNWVLSDGINTESVSVNQTPYWNMAIFWDNDNGTVNELWALKLYSLKLYESWTLVRDYVPCYRKADSVIWLYDLVNNVFYTNAGTGTFTKWADVNSEHPVENVYIEYSSN